MEHNSRETVSYTPTLYLWAAHYRKDRGPYSLIGRWLDDWPDSISDETLRKTVDCEWETLAKRWDDRKNTQLDDLERGLRAIRPKKAQKLCRRLLVIFRDVTRGQTSIYDEAMWSRVAAEEGYAWPPPGWGPPTEEVEP